MYVCVYIYIYIHTQKPTVIQVIMVPDSVLTLGCPSGQDILSHIILSLNVFSLFSQYVLFKQIIIHVDKPPDTRVPLRPGDPIGAAAP